MPLLCSMTIAGSIPVIVCVLLWKLYGNSFHISLGLRLLKISMFFYLIPVQLLYYILPWSVVGFWKNLKNNSQKTIRTYYSSRQLALQYHNQYIWIPNWMVALFSVWFIVISIFAVIQLIQYQHTQHTLLNQSFLEKVLIPAKNYPLFTPAENVSE